MQDSFFTTSLNYRNLLNQRSRTCLLRCFWYNNVWLKINWRVSILNIGKPRKLGKTINEIEEGDSLSLTESIEDNQLLLYLGLTNDANPLYIQHDFAQKTEYHQPIVPSVMLMGIITSAISKHLPGPGSHVVNFSVNFIEPVSIMKHWLFSLRS